MTDVGQRRLPHRPCVGSARSTLGGSLRTQVSVHAHERGRQPGPITGASMSDATPVRDPKTDALLTPQNAVLALIDYQPEQYAGVASVGHDDLLAHVTMLGRVATAFDLPVVLSTVYVRHGMS